MNRTLALVITGLIVLAIACIALEEPKPSYFDRLSELNSGGL